MRIYLHQAGTPATLHENVAATTRFDELGDGSHGFVFLDDGDEPVNSDALIADVLAAQGRKPTHHHVHRHPCRKIAVSVHYGGDTRDLVMTPNQTIGKVLSKAIAAYGLDAAAGSDLVLRIPGSDDDLTQSTHLGDLDVGPDCKLVLNLLPAHREAG